MISTIRLGISSGVTKDVESTDFRTCDGVCTTGVKFVCDKAVALFESDGSSSRNDLAYGKKVFSDVGYVVDMINGHNITISELDVGGTNAKGMLDTVIPKTNLKRMV